MVGLLGQLANYLMHPGLALAGVGAMAIPIVIHLLTRWRRRPQAWGAMRFLFEVYKRHRTRLQLEQFVLLAVRCLAILALAMALAGPLLPDWARAMGLETATRRVYFVIDDALSTRVADKGYSRFDQLREQALSILDTLEPDDRVAVVRAARPADAASIMALGPASEARRAIEEMKPRYSRSHLAQTLVDISQKLEGNTTDRALVVVLSDFSRGASRETKTALLSALGERAQVLLSKPMAAAVNTQITSLEPRRHMILAARSEPTIVPVRVRLRRFGDERSTRVTKLALSLRIADSVEPIAVMQREHQWTAGQTATVLQLDISIAAETLHQAEASDTWTTRGGQHVVVTAWIEPDLLPEDDVRSAMVDLRTVLDVGLIDAEGGGHTGGTGGGTPSDSLTPLWWLTLALEPFPGDEDMRIRIEHQWAQELDETAVGALDAAMVLRPDLIGVPGWRALNRLAERGGLVWIFAPTTASSPDWVELLAQHVEVGWTIGIEPTESKDAGRSQGWPLVTDAQVPEALQLIAADWPQLLRPIRILRRLPIDLKAGADQVWLRTDDANEEPLLLVAGIGEGHVVMFVTAMEPTWTNLPTKPLFVPLLHETLRSLLGGSSEATRMSLIVCGDRPLLGRRWDGAHRLVSDLAGTGSTLANEPGVSSESSVGPGVLLRLTAAGIEPTVSLDMPGLYWAEPAERNQPIIVNVDPDGGDTRTMEVHQVENWLGTSNGQWIDTDNPAASFATISPRTNLGWTLLWITLMLVLIEMCLARWFSHAQAPSFTTGMVRRWIDTARREQG